MAYQPFPLKLVGATSKNRSRQANNEITKNWYPEIPEGNAIAKAILLPWLGSLAFGTSGGNLDRGLHVWEGVLYHVVNQTLYSVDAAGVYVSIGTITGNQRAVFSNSTIGSANKMVIAAGSVYTYDGTTLVDSGLTASAVTYLNSKSIYPNGGFEFAVSGAGGPTTITSTGSAESSPDDLLRPYAFNQWVYMFGTETIEPFYDSGAGSPPLKRVSQAIMQKGLGGFYTIANTDQAMYFLGDDSNVYQIIQSQLTNISPPSIVNSIKSLNKDNATGFTINENGQDYYILWFADDISYAYSESLGEWFNLSSGIGDDQPYLAKSYARVYDKHIAADYRTSNTVVLGLNYYDDLSEVIQRRRVLPPFTSVDVGMPYGKRLIMSHVVFALQNGVGLVTGQGSDPKIMVEYSLDGGETWSTERWLKMGKLGQYLLRPKFDAMVSFYEITFRITVSDPVFCSLHDATIFIKESGY